jgi:UDP-glucose 4-epimerase
MGMRVLVSGMGGELGTRVASLFEDEPWVEAVTGFDVDPPRSRLRTTFHRIGPRDRRRIVALVREVEPQVLVHLGVYEPNARATPASAAERNHAAAVATLGAASECPSLEAIVVRSGVEVYGRERGAATRPDESVRPSPTTPFGRQLLDVEAIAADAAIAAGVPVTPVRLAPVVGPHIPSPLGRYLRLPLVPVSLFADPAFSVVHLDDAARALVAAARARFPGPLNVVAPGAVTPVQAARIGGRMPLPVAGPGWALGRAAAVALGAPVPAHVLELLKRGRSADGSAGADVLGATHLSTVEVVRELYHWATVTVLRPHAEVA